MAIMLKGVSGPQVLHLLDIPTDDVFWLSAQGFDVKVMATEIRFTNGQASSSVPCKMQTLTELKQGTIGELAKKTLRMAVVGIIKQLKKKFGDPDTMAQPIGDPTLKPATSAELLETTKTKSTQPTPGGAVLPSPGGGIMEMLAKNKPVKPVVMMEEPPKSCGAFPEFPAEKLKTAPTVHMLQATQLYQPVRGSSQGSRYFLVGANSELRIAARYKSDSLSIRIEGPGFAKNKGRLQACGFTGIHGDYASMHLSVADPVLASKTMGAILMGLGVKLDTPVPDILHLHNKGA